MRTGTFSPSGPVCLACLVLLAAPVQAQRADENAVAEADDAFGTVVGNEEIGLYSPTSARGFSPSQAGNLRVNGLYFDQGAGLNDRIRRGSTIHVGISAQGYPLPAPTGVVDFNLRVPGDEFITSVVAREGAILSYPRHIMEVDTQVPLIDGELSIGAGFGYRRNQSHQVAVADEGYSTGIIAHWRPTDSITITPFWSWSKISAVGGDRPRIFVGDNDIPRFRPEDMTSPDWLFFGFRQYNTGFVSTFDLGDGWAIDAGAFRSINKTPRAFTAFLLNTNEQGEGDYAIAQTPPRFVKSTSGELRLTKTIVEGPRRHAVLLTSRARDRRRTFGGADLQFFGRVSLGAFPDLDEPTFNTGPTTATRTEQITGALAYEGVWQNVGQLTAAIQKTSYKRTLTRPGGNPIGGRESPWLYNAGGAVFVSRDLALYASYTRGLEELGTAPGNAVNRDEAVPAEQTEQIDAGLRYQLSADVQLVAGVFQIDKPYYALDPANVYRRLGEVRHRGIEVSVTGDVTENLTIVAGAVFLKPRISDATAPETSLTAVGPDPRLIRINLQYRVPAIDGLALDTRIESVSSQFLDLANTRRIPGSVTVNAGLRYSTEINDVPVQFRLQGTNLTNTFSVNPNVSGQISPFQKRRVELSIAADF